MKNLVCTLETAKKLKEAGWNKETYFVWLGNTQKNLPEFQIKIKSILEKRVYGILQPIGINFPAPTLQEILDELPAMIKQDIDPLWLEIIKAEGYGVGYRAIESNNVFYEEDNSNPTEAAALLWLKLREEKLI